MNNFCVIFRSGEYRYCLDDWSDIHPIGQHGYLIVMLKLVETTVGIRGVASSKWKQVVRRKELSERCEVLNRG